MNFVHFTELCYKKVSYENNLTCTIKYNFTLRPYSFLKNEKHLHFIVSCKHLENLFILNIFNHCFSYKHFDFLSTAFFCPIKTTYVT